MEFSELNLHPDLKRGLDEAGYVTCMPVQEKVFAHSFSGEDIYAQSQTGTGKTAAFLISIFQRIMTQSDLRGRKALMLAPTRELAVQIENEARKLGKYLPISSGAFYGGVSYGPQVDKLRADVQIIIGTPGRITDLLQQGKMILNEVGFLVIDEADRMFDMGFIDDLRRLLRYLPQARERQTFLFSATLGLRVKDLAWEYMSSPKEISIEPEHVTVELVTQELYHVGNHEKFRLLLGILARENPKSALIFCNQKNMVEELARRLQVNGHPCEFIMGDLPQNKRLEVIERLKAGKLAILVATDVAARGLDVDALDLVINYDVPNEAESYVHRIGRTARAGKAGKAVTLACEKFVYNLYAIEKFLGYKIPVLHVEEDLLLEDKSVHIHYNRAPRPAAGSYMEHGRGAHEGRGRSDSRHEPRREGRVEARHDGRRLPPRGPVSDDRGNERRNDDRPVARPDIARPASAPGGDRPQRAASPAAARGPERDPYALPQDERMKIYKEKYAPAEGERKDARREGGRGGRQDSRPPRQDRPDAPRQGQREARNGQPVEPRQPRQPRSPVAAANANPIAPNAQAPARKPGILDRLKSIFGGKK